MHPTFEREGVVIAPATTWEVMAWNFSMSTESGEYVCIRPVPYGANLFLDRNWLTFVTRPAVINPPSYDFDDDIPF